MQHESLTAERWSAFTPEQQILMVANEMNRGSKLMSQEHRERLARAYERVLRLVDLTIQSQPRRGLRRELLRWRDLIAELYVSPEADPTRHRMAFRALLHLTPASARQIPFVSAARPTPGVTSTEAPG